MVDVRFPWGELATAVLAATAVPFPERTKSKLGLMNWHSHETRKYNYGWNSYPPARRADRIASILGELLTPIQPAEELHRLAFYSQSPGGTRSKVAESVDRCDRINREPISIQDQNDRAL